ncbi:hypothetical protein A0256_23855 [Mucilaginibacter sp. PAMC 26640]|nr:hypothetical protein A0256_23855 [Mucilaginibacter sp. PAMC 26640]
MKELVSEQSFLTANKQLISLNGIDRVNAYAMIDDFKSRGNGDASPTKMTFWFSKTMISNMIALLEAEIAEQQKLDPNREDVMDGVRIYFGSDPTSTGYPLKMSVILVSTIDNGLSTALSCRGKSGKQHFDWYEHDKNAPLFTSSGQILGAACEGSSNCGGALLYRKSGVSDRPGCLGIPHSIPRNIAEEMVEAFGKNPINTTGEWFDLLLFKSIVSDPDVDGMRVYFARNLKSSEYESERDAFIITCTKFNNTKKISEDYFGCLPFQNYKQEFEKKYFVDFLTPALDKGELCPDNCR